MFIHSNLHNIIQTLNFYCWVMLFYFLTNILPLHYTTTTNMIVVTKVIMMRMHVAKYENYETDELRKNIFCQNATRFTFLSTRWQNNFSYFYDLLDILEITH